MECSHSNFHCMCYSYSDAVSVMVVLFCWLIVFQSNVLCDCIARAAQPTVKCLYRGKPIWNAVTVASVMVPGVMLYGVSVR